MTRVCSFGHGRTQPARLGESSAGWLKLAAFADGGPERGLEAQGSGVILDGGWGFGRHGVGESTICSFLNL